MRRIAAFLFAALLGLPAMAEDAYPSRPITMISPYAPGGASDFLARTLAEALKTRLNQTVIVQNVGGAGGAVGSMQAARAKPDGYTLLLNHIGMSTIPLLYKKLNFDPLASFEFVGLFAEAPMVILARKDFAPRNFAELVAYAKANKEKLTVASAGMGSATHLCAMLFQEAIGVPLTTVQYKGAGPAVLDLRGGQVDLICDLPTVNAGLVRGGVAPNAVPADCEATLDIRYVPGQTGEGIRAEVQALADEAIWGPGEVAAGSLSVEILQDAKPCEVAPEAPIVKRILRHAPDAKITGSGGGTFAKDLVLMGVDAVGWSCGDEATYHQPNEEIEVEQLVTFAGRLANLVFEIANETRA